MQRSFLTSISAFPLCVILAASPAGGQPAPATGPGSAAPGAAPAAAIAAQVHTAKPTPERSSTAAKQWLAALAQKNAGALQERTAFPFTFVPAFESKLEKCKKVSAAPDSNALTLIVPCILDDTQLVELLPDPNPWTEPLKADEVKKLPAAFRGLSKDHSFVLLRLVGDGYTYTLTFAVCTRDGKDLVSGVSFEWSAYE